MISVSFSLLVAHAFRLQLPLLNLVTLTMSLSNNSPIVTGTKDTGKVAKNVLGGNLLSCCGSPVTGFYRNGYCDTGPQDTGRHTVCSQVESQILHVFKLKHNAESR